MNDDEIKAIDNFKRLDFFEYDWQIGEDEDFATRDDMLEYAEKMQKIILNVISRQQKEIEEKSTIIMAGAEKVKQLEKEIEDDKKFKKDIVSKIMFWDKEELPDNEVIIEMIDTLTSEVSRLEDIEDKKVEVAVDFIEEKRDKYWKDKIREKIKKYQEKAEDVKQKYKGVYAYKDDYLEALAKIEGYQKLLEEN